MISDIIPELVDFDDEIFLASRIFLGGPMLRRNTVTFKKLSLAENSFIGNNAIVRGKFIVHAFLMAMLLGLGTFKRAGKDERGAQMLH